MVDRRTKTEIVGGYGAPPATSRSLGKQMSLSDGFLKRLTGGPDLQYILLPPYEIPDIVVVGGIVVENRGRGPAHNVRITLEYELPAERLFHHLKVISESPYIVRSGGDKRSFATIRLQELGPQQRVIVYFSSHDQIAPQVRVSSYEKAAVERVTVGEFTDTHVETIG